MKKQETLVSVPTHLALDGLWTTHRTTSYERGTDKVAHLHKTLKIQPFNNSPHLYLPHRTKSCCVPLTIPCSLTHSTNV